MDGGFAESALMGALVSGGMGLATGKNPLNAAIMGGLTGGITGGVGNLAKGADFFASPALEGGNGIMGLFNAPTANTASTVGSMVDSGGIPYAALPTGAEGTIGSDMIQNQAGTFVNPATAGLAQTGAAAAKPGIMSGLKDTWQGLSPFEKAGAAGIGSYGLTKFMQPPELLDPNIGKQKSDHPLASLSPDFQGNFPVANVYRPTYAAEGGEMQSYAEGGIAALANGGQGMGSQGMGNNMGYPQGQQDHTQYATPSQMPTSAPVIDSGYEQNTNPYTGEPVGYAAGGMPPRGMGSIVNGRSPQQMSADMLSNSIRPAGMGQAFGGSAGLGMFGDPRMGGNQGYQGMGGWQDANGGMSGLAAMMGMGNLGRPKAAPVSRISPDFQAAQATPQVYTPHYAEGGIAGYSLGGYAAGGNPRLLKGPGDGMSDNIPAVIGNKQPARLANNEFVIPADVVSHLGNGSTDAGAKHLYDMMDRVRKARTGRTKQSPAIKADKYLPK